jgi:hypothetical protein
VTNLATQLNLEADEDAVVSFLDETGGILIRDGAEPGLYWAVLTPMSAPAERFYARIRWTQYPGAPASVRYADGVRCQTSVARAWPIIPGYRVPNDICKPFTAEGYGLHPDWKTGPTAWSSAGNPFLATVQQLQFDLNNQYGGRHQ